MTQLLMSGTKASAFKQTVEFRDDADKLALEEADDIFAWLEQTRRVDERAALLVSTIFPAVLSDALHCFYEALETSRKAKLNITFILVRKPLQESLFLLESVIADRSDFAEKLATDPVKLWSQTAGGLDVHAKRIQKVLDVMGEANRFDANYLAQLRYDKSAADGFDGVCNQAIHLFTGHKAIATQPMNINFIFSDWDSKVTQWAFLYGRLPYLLVYMHCLVEHVCADIAPTTPAYVQDIGRRISALIILWWETVQPPYINEMLLQFFTETKANLTKHCHKAGFRAPRRRDLAKMANTGAYPGEPKASITERNNEFIRGAKASGSL